MDHHSTYAISVPAEYFVFYATGLDGVFSDNPDIAVASRTEYFNAN